jgi:hypothetical protein
MSARETENSREKEKIQDLHSNKREPISQGRPFDEQERQEKNPDGSQQEKGS